MTGRELLRIAHVHDDCAIAIDEIHELLRRHVLPAAPRFVADEKHQQQRKGADQDGMIPYEFKEMLH